MRFVAKAALLLSAVVAACPAVAQSTLVARAKPCTIIQALPVVLDVPGRYCLDRDYSHAQGATPITISASNVFLDCRHHRISNQGGATFGMLLHPMYFTPGITDTSVQRCKLSGFTEGIRIGGTDNALPENKRLLIAENEISGFTRGIHAAATESRFIGNRLNGYRDPALEFQLHFGMELRPSCNSCLASDLQVQDNTIFNLRGSSDNTTGIVFFNAVRPQIVGNRIYDLRPAFGSSATAFAGTGSDAIVAHNRFFARTAKNRLGGYAGLCADNLAIGLDATVLPVFSGCQVQSNNVVRD